MDDFFKPEEALSSIGTLEETMEWISQIHANKPKKVSGGRALAWAIIEKFGKDELIGRFGEKEVLKRVGEAIRLQQQRLFSVINHTLRPEYRGETDLHDDVYVTSNAEDLFSFLVADDQSDDGGAQIDRVKLRSKHARLILALGIRGFLVEAVDEADWIAEDVRRLNERNESLFSGPMMRNICIMGQMSKNGEIVEGSIKVFTDFDEPEAIAHKESLKRLPGEFFETRMLCKTAELSDGRKLFIKTGSRRKALFDIVCKVARSNDIVDFLKDSRGTRHIIVAVEHDGKLTTPNRADAIDWADYVYKNAWSYPLIAKGEPFSRHGDCSASSYWDRKILGRLIAKHEGRIIGGRVEQQITTITDYLRASTGASEEHHDIYSCRRFYEKIIPQMWPHFNWLRDDRLESHREFWRHVTAARNGIKIC